MKHRDSIEDLYRQYYQEILNYLFRRTHHLETAKDLAQDTFVKALNGLSSFRGILPSERGFIQLHITPLLIGTAGMSNTNLLISAKMKG